MTATPRRVRLWLFRLATVLGALVAGLLVAEGAIRIYPNLLNDRLRHAAFSKYDTLPGGIFLFEGLTRSRVMRANHRTRAYSHGYFWTHETDARGYRNPREVHDHRVLLLGDSIVYGHGVESGETVAHFLRTQHSVAAYDMSAQGQCIYEHYLALRLLLGELRPETALLFVYVNDINDLENRGRARGGPDYPEVASFHYQDLRDRIERLQAYREPLMVRVAFSSAIARLTAKTRGWRPSRPPESTTPKQWRQQSDDQARTRAGAGNAAGAVLDDARFAPIERYYDTVLADLADRCDRLGVRLVVVHLVPPSEKDWRERDRAQVRLQRSLEAICSRHGLDLVDTRELFEGRTEWILPDDGHLNSAGHQALASFLHREILGQPSPFR
jgi:hypothetical protein